MPVYNYHMMTRKLRLHTLLVLLALCQFATVFGAGKHIKLNLKKGETYKYSQSIDMNIKQVIQGQDVDMNIKMITHTSFYVTDVSGRIVRRMDTDFLEAGEIFRIDISDLPSGVYWLSLKAQNLIIANQVISVAGFDAR